MKADGADSGAAKSVKEQIAWGAGGGEPLARHTDLGARASEGTLQPAELIEYNFSPRSGVPPVPDAGRERS